MLGQIPRFDSLQHYCSEYGIALSDENTIYVTNSQTGGIEATQNYLQRHNRPKMLLCETGDLVAGILTYLRTTSYHIPVDFELLCYGFVLSPILEFSIPSISNIVMPTPRICQSALEVLMQAKETRDTHPKHILLDIDIMLKDSFSLSQTKFPQFP